MPASPWIELIKQTPAILLALGVLAVPLGTLLMQILVFRRQGRIDAKVEKIDATVAKVEEHSNGMRAVLEKPAYDRGVSDEKTGDAAPKATAPQHNPR